MPKPDEDYTDTYAFKIDNVSLCEGRSLVTNTMYTYGKHLQDFRFHIEFSFSRYCNPEPYVSCFIVPVLNRSGFMLEKMTCQIELLDENNCLVIKREFSVSPYDGKLKIGCSRFVSPFKVFDVLAVSKKDTIILRCGIGKHTCLCINHRELYAVSYIEADTYSFKWIIKDKITSWKMAKTITILHTSMDITLEERLIDIDIKFKFDMYLYTILVCRVTFFQDDIELLGIRDSKVFKHQDSWQFPKIEKKSLEKKTLLYEEVLSVHFEFSFLNGEFYNVIKPVGSPFIKVEKKSRKSTRTPIKKEKI